MQEQLTTRQVAELLGVDVWRVQRLFELGVLPELPRFAGRRVVPGKMIPDIVDGLLSQLASGGRGGHESMNKAFYSLAEIATRWGCSHSSVLALVRSGALTAIDISTHPTGRSRYIVATESLEAFEASRTVTPPSAPTKRREKVRRSDVIEFIT